MQFPAGTAPLGDPERQLISEVLRKDRKATAEFVTRCSDWLYPFLCRRLMPRTDMVEDLMQEILLAAWQNLEKFRGEAGLRTWIFGIAHHKVEDYYRKRVREAASLEDEEHSVQETLTPQFEEELDGVARQERIQRTLARLPEGGFAMAIPRRKERPGDGRCYRKDRKGSRKAARPSA